MTALSGRGRAWRNLRTRVLFEESCCGLCGGWVDKSLPNPHPGAPQVDHIVPVSLAPELVMVRSNLRLVHRKCNLKRNAELTRWRRRRRRPQPPPRPTATPVFGPLTSSREW